MSGACIRPTVFIGHPYTLSPDRERVLALIAGLREALVARGFAVRPLSMVGSGASGPVTRPARDLVVANVDDVVDCDLVVLVDDHAPSTTSMWVEAGMALAARRPTIIISPDAARLPFLVRAAVGAGSDGLPPWSLITDVALAKPGIDLESLAARLTSWARAHGIGP